MSEPRPPQAAKLIIGFFMKDREPAERIQEKLSGRYGEIDRVSPWLAFDYTDYYAAEMGGPLFRQMLVFRKLIAQESLPDIKRHCYDLEAEFSREGKRRVNIDPGYLLPERFVLATGKNFTHRIYIGKEIYADLTLIYSKGDFQTLPWTYPDYADEKMLRFLREVRKAYITDIKGCKQ